MKNNKLIIIIVALAIVSVVGSVCLSYMNEKRKTKNFYKSLSDREPRIVDPRTSF